MNIANDKLDLTEEIKAIKRGKMLYIISFALAIGLSVFYAVFSSKVYHNEAVIMIEKDSGSAPLQGLFSENSQIANLFSMSGLGSSTMDDELIILQSHDCFCQAIRNIGANRTYSERVGLHKLSLFGKSPVLVEAPKEFFDTLSTSLKMTIELTGNGAASAKLTSGFMNLFTMAEAPSQALPYQFKTPYGDFQLLKTDFYTDSKDQTGRKINVRMTRNGYLAESLQKSVKMDEVNKKANAVEIDYDFQDPDFGRAFIGSLIASYRLMRRQHQSEQAASKISFLDKRIELLTSQLEKTEAGVQNYMKENQIIDVDTQTAILLEKTTIVRDSIFYLKTQQMIHEAILQTLMDPNNQYQLLGQESAGPLVNSYNDLILKRTEMLQSAKPGNTALQNLETKIADMRSIVIENSHRTMANNDVLIKNMSQQVGNESKMLGNMPGHKIMLLNDERDLQLQNNLLIYLLQERENALLRLNSEEELGFVVDQPFTAKKTVKTKMMVVSLILFAMALCVPTAWVLWRMPRKKDAEELV